MLSEKPSRTSARNAANITTPSATTGQAPTPRSPRRTIRYSVELCCLLCARDVGVLESDRWPSCSGTLLRPQLQVVQVPDWHHLRCETCGGSIIPEEMTRRWLRNEAPIDWLADRPRRGRPPKRLAAQRGAGGPAA